MIFEFPILNESASSLPIYIEELGILENQDHVIRSNTYENNQLLICSGGEGKLIVDDKEYIITDKHIFFTEKNTPHEYYAIKEPWTISWIVFDGDYTKELMKQLNLKNHEVFQMTSIHVISNLFEEALAMLKSNNTKKHIECSILIYTILTKLSYCKREHLKNNSKTKKEMTFEMILAYVEKNYTKDISLTDLSTNFGLSKYYISRVFKEYSQLGLITYLNQYRISNAKKMLLQDPSTPVKSIAQQIGFKEPSYFSALFKASEGMTPVEFRQLHGFFT